MRINRIHSAWTPESKWQSGNLILLSPRWSVAEGDVSYTNVMRVKSFSYPTTGWPCISKRTCASQQRQARYAELSRAMLPWCSTENIWAVGLSGSSDLLVGAAGDADGHVRCRHLACGKVLVRPGHHGSGGRHGGYYEAQGAAGVHCILGQ